MFRIARRLFSNIKYTKTHEWIVYDPATKRAKVGISNFAQQQIGQVIHVEFPTTGKQLKEKDSAAVVESVKIAADIYTPVSGKIKSWNKEVQENPSLLNEQPLKAWIFQIECNSQPQGLMSEQDYLKIIG